MRWDIPPIGWWEAEHVGDRWRCEVARGEVRPTWLDPGDGGQDDLDPGEGGEDDDLSVLMMTLITMVVMTIVMTIMRMRRMLMRIKMRIMGYN